MVAGKVIADGQCTVFQLVGCFKMPAGINAFLAINIEVVAGLCYGTFINTFCNRGVLVTLDREALILKGVFRNYPAGYFLVYGFPGTIEAAGLRAG